MFRRFLREYLSFTSGERRGFLILVSLVFAMILLRMMLPGQLRPSHQVDPPRQVASPNQVDPPIRVAPAIDTSAPVYFAFDPNTAGLDTLIFLGLPPRTARILVNYRERGGRFRNREDLLKIYGLEEEDYLLLEPWISIPALPEHEPPQATPAPSSGTGFFQRIDLNLADTSLLMEVHGIGPVFSSRIIKFRELLGGFYTLGQLREVYGLSDEQFSALSGSCYADSSRIRRMNLNTAGREEMERHPYLDAYQVSALLSYRTTIGDFSSLDEIRENRLLPPAVFRKISPYLEVEE